MKRALWIAAGAVALPPAAAFFLSRRNVARERARIAASSMATTARGPGVRRR